MIERMNDEIKACGSFEVTVSDEAGTSTDGFRDFEEALKFAKRYIKAADRVEIWGFDALRGSRSERVVLK